MISKRDVQLGKIALKAGFIDKDQLTKCLALKKKLVKTKGKKVALGSLLLKKGYLTKEQLEECVRLHNEKLDQSGDVEKKRSRRSKRVKAEGDKPEKADEASTSTRKKRKKKEAGKDEVEATKATATATKKTKTSARARSKTSARTEADTAGQSARKSNRAKTSREAARSNRSKKESGKTSATGKAKRKTKESDVSDIGSEVESAVDTVDAALFASAPEDAVETDRKRLIACPDCGKKYRVKKRQVGKRFSCRRCDHRVKVPKDLFQRPVEVRSAVEVEEFVLGGSQDTLGDSEDEAVTSKSRRKKQVGKAASKAASAVQKVGKTASIRELANKAATSKPKSLAPKKAFGLQGLVTMLVLAGMLAAVLGGGMYAFVWAPAAKKEETLRKGAEEELAAWTKRLNTVLAAGAAAAEAKRPRAIASALTELGKVQAEAKALIQGDNQTKAAEMMTSQGVDATALKLRMDQGRLLLEQGGPSAAEDALLVLKLAAKAAPGNGEVLLAVARTQLKARRYRDAAETLKPVSESLAPARVLRGMALELGDVPGQAAQVYAGLDDPLKDVLAARAHVVARGWSNALRELEKVSGLQGEDLALAKLVEGRARAGAGEHSKAISAFDMAVANAKDNPVPLLARAEYHLSRGKPKSALRDAEASTTKGASARGFLAQGDAHLALLDPSKAKTAYRNAIQGEPTPIGRKIADEIGVFVDPLVPDARIVARCRLAFLLAARGGKGSLGEAQQLVGDAINAAPFSPYALSALVLLNKVNKVSAATDDAYLERALSLSKRLDAKTTEDVIRTPETGFLLLATGAHMLESNRLDPALKALTLAAKLAPSLEAAARCLRGRVYLEKRLISKAQTELERAIDLEKAHPAYKRARQLVRKLKKGDDASFKRLERGLLGLLGGNPYYASAYLLLARARVRTRKPEQYKQALKDLTQAIEINPGMREAYTTRGFLYLRYLPKNLRDTSKGGKDIKKSLELEGKSPRASSLYGLALYHWNRGDAAAAHQALGHCLRRDSKYRDAFKLRETIYRFEGKAAEADKAKKSYERLGK